VGEGGRGGLVFVKRIWFGRCERRSGFFFFFLLRKSFSIKFSENVFYSIIFFSKILFFTENLFLRLLRRIFYGKYFS